MQNIFIELLPPWIETGLQPAFYDKESGTVLQQTSRMYAKVNELIQSVNNQNTTIAEYIQKFVELKDYVDTYFENLDVQEEINNKLDQMAEDGTLTRLLQSLIDVDDTFNFHTLFATEYYRTGDTAKGMQGGCVLPDGTIIQATGHDKVQHWSSTGTLLNEVTLAIGHANGCCYNSKLNKVLFTSTQSDTIGKYKVFIVDPTTLALENTIDCADKDFPATPYGITYLEDEEHFVFVNYWQPNYSKYMWKTDRNFNVISVEKFDFDVSATSNLGKFGNYLGVAELPSNKVFLFNYDMSFYKQIDINPLVSDTWFITELEWFDTLDGDIYLGFIPMSATDKTWGDGAKVYAKFDPAMNYRETKRGTETMLMPYTERYYVLHTDNTDPLRDGSSSKPFSNINEALNSALRTENNTGIVEIHLLDNVVDTYVPYFSMNKTYRIFTDYEGRDYITSFSAIVVSLSSRVEIRRGVTLTGNSPVTVISANEGHIQCNGHLVVDGDVNNSITTQLKFSGSPIGYCKLGLTNSGFDTTYYAGVIDNIDDRNINVNNMTIPAYSSSNHINTRSINRVTTGEISISDGNYPIPFLSNQVKVRIRFNVGSNLQNERMFDYVFGQYARYSFLKEDDTVEKITFSTDGKISFTSGISNIRVYIIS